MEKYYSKLLGSLSGRSVITTAILHIAGSWIFQYGIISRVQGKAIAAGGRFEEVLYPQRRWGATYSESSDVGMMRVHSLKVLGEILNEENWGVLVLEREQLLQRFPPINFL